MIDEARRKRWEDHADWPLTFTAVLFLVAYAAPILRPDLVDPLPTICELVTWAAWAFFVVDYVARLALSQNRRGFVRGNPVDLAAVALPLLRPLRLLRLVALLSVLNRYAGNSLRGRVAVYVAGSTSLVLFVASLAVLDAERSAKGATITTFGDALWWAITTVTTVGYGDRYPITTQGRFIAGALMLAGIALLGIVTAALASWLLDKVRDVEEHVQAATQADLDMLTAEVRALRADLADRNQNRRTPGETMKKPIGSLITAGLGVMLLSGCGPVSTNAASSISTPSQASATSAQPPSPAPTVSTSPTVAATAVPVALTSIFHASGDGRRCGWRSPAGVDFVIEV